MQYNIEIRRKKPLTSPGSAFMALTTARSKEGAFLLARQFCEEFERTVRVTSYGSEGFKLVDIFYFDEARTELHDVAVREA